MEAIKAMVRNGRIETDGPVDLPDGTKVLILRSNTSDSAEDQWDDSPEGIAAWLKWYDSLDPLIFTDKEREAWKQDQKNRKEWELAHADERSEKLRRLWE